VSVNIDREFVGLASPIVGRAGAGGHPCQGVYHTPTGARSTVAFIATHYNIDFSEHYLADYMAQRGYGFLGWNTRFRGAEAHFLLDHALAEIGVGVSWLREKQGIETVVLLANSGGGSLMAAYQSQAVEPNVAPERGMRPLEAIQNLPACDFYISLAAHLGRPDVLTDWMDPSVTDESDPLSVDPSLNMFDPANGPPYPPEFVARYRSGQVARNDRVTAWVLSELDRLAANGVRDRLFTLQRTWADLRTVDPSLDPNDRVTPACYIGDPERANYGVFGVGTLNTLHTWLSMWSLEESQCRAEPHLARITVPTLVLQASADSGVFPRDAKRIHDAVTATDKTLMIVDGDHYLREPAGARDELSDIIAGWLQDHNAS